jgi:hydroxypyruvate isomerase
VLIGSATEAAVLIEHAGAENLRLQYDVFHGFRAGEDPAVELVRHGALLGHVQIADAPGRHEPGTGAIDFGAVFAALERIGYAGYVGLEYIPATTTEAGLGAIATLR